LIFGTEVQLIVFYPIIETEVTVKSLFYLLLVNLPLLASFNEIFLYRKLNCFLDDDDDKLEDLENKDLTDEAIS